MENQIGPIARMVNQLSRLPGIGKKSAQRLAYYLISLPIDEVKQISYDIYTARREIRYCDICGNYSTDELCSVCSDRKRDNSIICVVRDPRDVIALERVQAYKGVYHVLHGTLSPMNNIGPDDINIRGLVDRVNKGNVKEIILATNPDIEGEATASYIARLLEGSGVRITRIARGVPIGSDLEYADEITLSKALEGRREI